MEDQAEGARRKILSAPAAFVDGIPTPVHFLPRGSSTEIGSARSTRRRFYALVCRATDFNQLS